MPGKRPRPLRRTSSVSLLGSESFALECSPLPEHPKEKLKPTHKEPVPCAPRLVIGFNPKPNPEAQIASQNVISSKITFPILTSPTGSHEKQAGSPRSGLESLLSVPRPWERKEVEGVGLGIVAALHVATSGVGQEERVTVKVVTNPEGDIAHPSTEERGHSSKSCQPVSSQHPRKQSYPIPIQVRGTSPSSRTRLTHHLSSHQPSGIQQPPLFGDEGQGRTHQTTRPVQAWLQQTDSEVDRHDTFLLGPSPVSREIVTAMTAAASSAVHFLDACYFCKRHLGEGKDIYMYRGDKAFCSPECRAQQILLDDRRENCSAAALKAGPGTPSRHASHRSRVVPAGTVAAA